MINVEQDLDRFNKLFKNIDDLFTLLFLFLHLFFN